MSVGKVAVLTGGNIPSYWAHSMNVMKVAQGFASLGFETHVVSADSVKRRVMARRIPDLNTHYSISRDVNVHFLQPSPWAFLKGRTSHDDTYCRRVARYAASDGFDLAYCRSYLIPYYTALAGIPTIVETHTTDYDHPALQKIYDVAHLPAFKGLVTIHESIRREHVNRGIPEEKTLVIETSVDIRKFEIEDDARRWKQCLGLDPDKQYGTYCGQLYPYKGIEVKLAVAKKMERRQDVVFHLMGGPDKWRRHWESVCRRERIANVLFPGFIANAEVPKFLKASDCLLLPYRLDMVQSYTSPVKLFEYMAAKRAIVATGIPSVSKVLQHRRNALLAPPGDVDAFGGLVKEALDDPALSLRLGDTAYQDARKYTSTNKCQAMLSALTDLGVGLTPRAAGQAGC